MAYGFGDYVLDAEGYSLRRGDEEVHLEPRVLELLVTLVENRQRVVPKDELLETVWEGQFVGESALTRAVYEVRRALGEDSKRQQHIKTVHGRGYQFVADVSEFRADPSGAPVGDAAPPGDAGGEGSGTSGDRREDGRRGLVPSLLVAAVVAAIAFVGFADFELLDGPESPPTSAPAVGDSPDVHRIAVLPFTLDESGAEAELTALSLTDLLWARLGTLPGIIVRSPEYGRGAVESAPSIGTLASEARVEALVAGRVTPIGSLDRSRVEVRLYRVEPSGGLATVPIGRYELPRLASAVSLDEFVRVREAIVDDVAEHLVPALAVPPVQGLSPRDPEAFRLYLLARERFATITCGDTQVLLDLLDRSLEIDPGFALAWVARGFALYSQTWSCGRDATFTREALAAAERALEVERDLPLALFLKSILLVELGRAEDAFALLRRARGRHPHAPGLAFAESYAFRYAGFLPEAEARLWETLDLDPLFLREFGYAPLPLFYRGDLETFLEVHPATNTPHDRFYRGLALLARGERGAARDVLEPAFRLNPTDLFARFSAALVALLDGDRDTASRIVEEVVSQRDRLGTPDGEMTFKEAQLLALAGADLAALDRLEQAVGQGFFCPSCILDDPFLGRLRDEPDFRGSVTGAERRHAEFAGRFGPFDEPRSGS